MIDFIVETIRMSYASRSLDSICEHLSRQFPVEEVRAARRIVEAEIQRIRVLRDPPALLNPELSGWYPGPSNDDIFWPTVKERLLTLGWSESSVNELDKESLRLSCL